MNSTREKLITDHLYLIDIVATRLISRLPPQVELDDLKQSGRIGLMDAAEKFDILKDVKFSTYAEWRIRGEMLDELRRRDIVPRTVRDTKKSIDRITAEYQRLHGRKPTEAELTEGTGLTPEQVEAVQIKSLAHEISIYHPESFSPSERAALSIACANQHTMIEKLSAMQKLERFVAGHSSINQAIFKLYYIWGLNGQEIAELFGCTEGRVSQRRRAVETGFRGRIERESEAA